MAAAPGRNLIGNNVCYTSWFPADGAASGQSAYAFRQPPRAATCVGMDANGMRVAALINERAGAVARRSGDAFGRDLASAFAGAGIAAELQFVPGERMRQAAVEVRERAARGELDAVAVAGGDGTVGAVASALAGTGIPLGVLALGTLNHFAKDLGIPLELPAAVAMIGDGHVRSVDVADVNGQVFVNNSSIGLYPYMVLDRERRRSRHGQAKWAATVLAAFRTLRYLPVRRLSVRAGGWDEPCRTPCVFVGNNQYRLAGPALGTRERLDEGRLSLYVAPSQSRSALLLLAMRSALGLVDEKHDLRVLQADCVEIGSRTSRLLVSLDGEVAVLRPPLTYRLRPSALTVFSPLPGNAAP
jgi:diacylglycerol kinase family enzyme